MVLVLQADKSGSVSRAGRKRKQVSVEIIVHPDTEPLAAAVAVRLITLIIDAQAARGRAGVMAPPMSSSSPWTSWHGWPPGFPRAHAVPQHSRVAFGLAPGNKLNSDCKHPPDTAKIRLYHRQLMPLPDSVPPEPGPHQARYISNTRFILLYAERKEVQSRQSKRHTGFFNNAKEWLLWENTKSYYFK
jgi:hypothetical protein